MSYIKTRDVTLIGISLLPAVEFCAQEIFCLKNNIRSKVVFGVVLSKNPCRTDKE